jgi:hypothetical protein
MARIQVMVIQVIQVKVIQEAMVAIQVIQDMEVMEDMDMDTHMVNNIAIVNLQQENLLTNSVLHQETITNLNIPIKMELNSRTQISTEEPSSLTFNNHQPPLQLTLRECL